MPAPPADRAADQPTALSVPGGQARAERLRFAALLERVERQSLHRLAFDDLRDLAALYRVHAARLALARDRDDDPDAVRALNTLCARAHAALFASGARRAARPWRLALRDALGRTWRTQLLAWALLAAGLLLGGALAWHDPLAVHALIPGGMGYGDEQLDALIASPAARAAFFERETMPAAHKTLFGSFLFANNTRVGLLALAGGMLAGVPTVLLTLYNGIVLGAFASIFLRDPWPLAFLAWILPHGIPELTAICLCAAAGLQLGAAVAMPGRAGRAAALAEAVPPVLVLFAAAVVLFVVAALIESFVRESTWGTAPRLGVAALCVLAAAALLLASRRAAGERADTAWLAELAGGGHRSAP